MLFARALPRFQFKGLHCEESYVGLIVQSYLDYPRVSGLLKFPWIIEGADNRGADNRGLTVITLIGAIEMAMDN